MDSLKGMFQQMTGEQQKTGSPRQLPLARTLDSGSHPTDRLAAWWSPGLTNTRIAQVPALFTVSCHILVTASPRAGAIGLGCVQWARPAPFHSTPGSRGPAASSCGLSHQPTHSSSPNEGQSKGAEEDPRCPACQAARADMPSVRIPLLSSAGPSSLFMTVYLPERQKGEIRAINDRTTDQ